MLLSTSNTMQKYFPLAIILGICSAAFLFADDPSSDPTPPPAQTQPPANHYVGASSSYRFTLLQNDPSAPEYCAFLETKGTTDGYMINDYYYDSVFMVDAGSKLNSNTCIVRSGSSGNYSYTVPVGRENYIIQGVTSETAFNTFNSWTKNPKAVEIRNYINDKIAESVSNCANYADNAESIQYYYTNNSFFNDLNLLTLDLLGNSATPITFDANGVATICLSDPEAGKSLIYFDHNVSLEGDESSDNFIANPPPSMNICAHLYSGATYYRPSTVRQTPIAPTN